MFNVCSIDLVKGKMKILNNLSLTLQPGRILGLITLNELESESLIKVMGGHLPVLKGSLEHEGKLLSCHNGKSFDTDLISVHYGTEKIISTLSLLDNIYLSAFQSVTKGGILSRSLGLKRVKPFLDYFSFQPQLDASPQELSKEDLLLCALFQFLVTDSQYYALGKMTDELSVERYKLFQNQLLKMKAAGKGLLFVPDNPNQVYGLCDEVIIVRNGQIVLHRAVKDIKIDEIYNIQNNTPYTIDQAIENKFHQHRANITQLEQLAEKTLTILENFCGISIGFVGFLDTQGGAHLTCSPLLQKTSDNGLRTKIRNFIKREKNQRSKNLSCLNYSLTAFPCPKSLEGDPVVYLNLTDETNKKILGKIFKEFYYSYEVILTRYKNSLTEKERERHSIRLGEEMNIARNLQTSILPRKLDVPGFEAMAFMETATEVGGDNYDIANLRDGTMISIGDVSGHGLPSGIMAMIEMAAFQGVMEIYKTLKQKPGMMEVYESVNKVLCRMNRDRLGSDKFMTKNYLLVQENHITHVGTHEVGLVYRKKNNVVEELPQMVDGTAFLGLSEFIESEASVGSFSLDEGDLLLLYTDGVIEAKNAGNEQFGIDRLKEILFHSSSLELDQILKNVRREVWDFSQEGDVKKHQGHFADDLTLVLLRENHAPSPKAPDEDSIQNLTP